MSAFHPKLHNSLVTKLLLSVGAILLVSLCFWGYFHLRSLESKVRGDLAANVDRLSNTIRLGTRYAMMTNSRDDIKHIINNVARQNDIESIRIYNKDGRIKFSNHADEVEQRTNIKDEACFICHKTEPPETFLNLAQRLRMTRSADGYRQMGIISPVYNETGCASDACHVHPADKTVLGALDLVVSLKSVDQEIVAHKRNFILLAAGIFGATGLMIVIIIFRFVTIPVKRLISGARRIENGDYDTVVQLHQQDELQELAEAINQMGRAIGDNAKALNQQRDEYQNLFETVPCIITVQDRDYRLIGYNREFADRFSPRPGDFCYQAYKGLQSKCVPCPVEKTFADGLSHNSEETAVDRDGSLRQWIVRTTPIKDAEGRIVAAMEMNLDISDRKLLEEKLAQSEKKYRAIFSNIPIPVFALDPNRLTILECNESVASVYTYRRDELLGHSFRELFRDPDDADRLLDVHTGTLIERARQRSKDGLQRYVTIRVSPSEYGGTKVLLVTVSDITERLETEQQLIQAGKMAKLGEMATGVAHELNQPLSVIKTASSFFMRKLRNKQPIEDHILLTLAEEIDRHVDRASKIISHMRQFGRKTDPDLKKIQINDVLVQASDIFSQQLKVRGIDIAWELGSNLPDIMGDPARLEQVIINLLVNARDAIEARCAAGQTGTQAISLATAQQGDKVTVRVCDTGEGIPDALLEKIFEPFFTTKKVGQGTGLGLSISYGIIKECGGQIYARPNHSGGACFIIEFPIPVDPT